MLVTAVTPDDLQRLLQLAYAWAIAYSVAKTAAGAAVLCMLRERFGGLVGGTESESESKSRRWRYAWLAALIVTILAGVAAAAVGAAQCVPVSGNWDIDALVAGTAKVPARAGCLDRQAVVLGTNVALGAASVGVLALAFFLIVCDKVAWRRKLLNLFYWVFGLL